MTTVVLTGVVAARRNIIAAVSIVVPIRPGQRAAIISENQAETRPFGGSIKAKRPSGTGKPRPLPTKARHVGSSAWLDTGVAWHGRNPSRFSCLPLRGRLLPSACCRAYFGRKCSFPCLTMFTRTTCLAKVRVRQPITAARYFIWRDRPHHGEFCRACFSARSVLWEFRHETRPPQASVRSNAEAIIASKAARLDSEAEGTPHEPPSLYQPRLL